MVRFPVFFPSSFSVFILTFFLPFFLMEALPLSYKKIPLQPPSLTLSSNSFSRSYLQSITSFVVGGYLNKVFGNQNSTLSGTRYISPYILPTTIGTPGIDGIGELLIQPDHKLVLVGSTASVVGLNITSSYFSAVRLSYPEGSIDTTFGGQNGAAPGTTYIPFHIAPGANTEICYGGVLQSDGKIVIAGASGTLVENIPTAGKITLARFNSDGSLDTTFGNQNGAIFIANVAPGSTTDACHGITIQSDGKILVVGTSGTLIAGNYNQSFLAIARLTPQGTLDPTFGGQNGAAAGTTYITPRISGGVLDRGNSIQIQPDNKILVLGTTTSGAGTTYIAIARLNSDGSLDTTFGGQNGVQAGTTYITPTISGGTSDGADMLALQDNNLIVISGDTTDRANITHIAVARLNNNESLDTTFGGQNGAPKGTTYISGTIAGGTTNNDTSSGFVLQTDNKIIVAGKSARKIINTIDLSYPALLRFNSDGSLDTTFGGASAIGPNARPGTTYIAAPLSANPAPSTALFSSIAMQYDGSLVCGGISGGNINTSTIVDIPSQSFISAACFTNNYIPYFPAQGGFY